MRAASAASRSARAARGSARGPRHRCRRRRPARRRPARRTRAAARRAAPRPGVADRHERADRRPAARRRARRAAARAPAPRAPSGDRRASSLRARGARRTEVPAELVAGLGRLGLRDVGRVLGQRLEEVLDQVLGGQALDQLALLERDRGLVGDRAEEPVLLGGERPRRARGRAQARRAARRWPTSGATRKPLRPEPRRAPGGALATGGAAPRRDRQTRARAPRARDRAGRRSTASAPSSSARAAVTAA